MLTDDDVRVSDPSNFDVVLRKVRKDEANVSFEKKKRGKIQREQRRAHHGEDESSYSEREETQGSWVSELSVVDRERRLAGIDWENEEKERESSADASIKLEARRRRSSQR